MLEIRPYQREALEALDEYLRTKDGNPCVVLPTGCHAAGHPILMFDGSVKPVEDVREGDVLMGDDSSPRTVLRLHRGEDEMFKVIPKKGKPFIVNGEHVLSLECTREKGTVKYRSQKKGGEIDNISVRGYLGKSKSWKHLRKLRRVPVDFNGNIKLPVDPYILGLLLGDGCLTGCISYTTADIELADIFRRYAVAHSGECRVAHKTNNKAKSYFAVSIEKTKGKNRLLTYVKQLGLYDHGSADKFIPHDYLVAPRKDRLNLLAGLIDTDGFIDHCVDFVTESDALANDVVFLARSLGFAAHARKKSASCQTGAIGVYNRICISGDLSLIPFRRNRHILAAKKRLQKKNVLRTGFSIEYVGIGNYYGFELDGNHLYVDGNFIVHHNSGKSLVMAEAIRRWKEAYPPFRAIVLAHRKELVDQNSKEFLGLLEPVERQSVGIYSSGLGYRDMDKPITFAAIDSVYNKAGHFKPFDAIIVDEAHRIPVRGEGKYRTFLDGCQHFNPNLRVIGFTATPYRLGSGMVCHKDYILNEIAYEANVGDLIRDGYLCNLRSKVSAEVPDLSEVKKQNGDYQQKALGITMRANGLVERAVSDALLHLNAENRTSCVWFCVDVEHCQQVLNALRFAGETAYAVTGNTSNTERDQAVEAFRNRQFRHILNVNVFTEGFNVKQVDAVVLLRPTLSKGLYVQMVGRGLRLHPDKSDCLILDYAHCIETHGPIDARDEDKVAVEVCGNCREVFARGLRVCPRCGWEIPKRVIEEREKVERERRMHEAHAAQLAILGTIPTEYPVSDVTVSRHVKNGTASLCVAYRCGIQLFREWVCLDHEGYAREKAEMWWKARFGDDARIPSVDEALEDMFLGYEIKKRTESITVKKVGRYNEIIRYKLKGEEE